MRRVITPGGRLVLTTHGEQTIAHDASAALGRRPSSRIASARSAERGFWYADEFGERATTAWRTPTGAPRSWRPSGCSPSHPGLAGRAVPPRAGRAQPGPLRARAAASAIVSVSVVIPVKDGGALLGRPLEALRAQGADRAARDRLRLARRLARRVARAAGAELIEIAPAEFGHGRTRNLGAERTSGRADLLPHPGRRRRAPGWLAAYREAFALDRRRRAPSFGPHLPRAGHEPDDRARADRVLRRLLAGRRARSCSAAATRAFLSNVNACYRRDCWERAPLRRRRLRRGPGVRAARCSAPAGAKVFHPGAAVLHAHDYGPVEFMRRYFDEYRGLRETIGHVEPLRRALAGAPSARRSARDRALDARAAAGRRRARGALDGALGRAPRAAAGVFSALGSRADRLPAGAAARALAGGRRRVPRPPRALRRRSGARIAPRAARPYERRADASPRGPGAARSTPVPGMAEREPPARRGRDPAVPARQRRPQHDLPAALAPRARWATRARSGCTTRSAATRRVAGGAAPTRSVEYFAPVQRARVQRGFDALVRRRRRRRHRLADRLPGAAAAAAAAPAPTSSTTTSPSSSPPRPSRLWAERTYSLGCIPIAASPWLRDLLARRYGAHGVAGSSFGVDHASTARAPVAAAPRHGPLLRPRRHAAARRPARRCSRSRSSNGAGPTLRIVLFGDDRAARRPRSPTSTWASPSPEQLAWRYSEATVGLCAVADELLADPAGDAGLRAAVRRPRRRAAPSRCSAPTGRSSWRRPTRSRSRRARAPAATRRAGGGARRRGSSSCATRPGTPPRGRSRRGCARRCAAARPPRPRPPPSRAAVRTASASARARRSRPGG